jgi:hypothetical protein
MDEMWPITLFMSCAIVTAFALVGFNQPSWSRTYTSAARFRFAALAHAALYLLAMGIVYALLRRVLSTSPTDTLSLALVITLVARSISPISRRVRHGMHGLAGVPESAQHLARVLASAGLQGSEEVRQEARDVLVKRGVDVTSEWVPIVQPVQQLLFKATTLFIQLRRWEEDRKYAHFLAEARHEIAVLRKRFDQMSFRISRVLATIERLGEVRHHYSQASGQAAESSERLDDLLRTVVSDLIADSCEEIDSFHEDACLLAARGAFATRWTHRGRDALIAGLGFVRQHEPRQGVFGILAWTFVMLFFGMWVYFNLLPADNSQITNKARISIVTIIVFGAFAIAIVPKLRWGFANGGLHEKTPIKFVIGAGIAAMAFAIVVNMIAGALLIGGLSGAWARVRIGAPFLPSAFLTAATVAILVQDHQWRSTRSEQLRRVWDAATLGGVWVLSSGMAMVLRVWLHDIAYPEPSEILIGLAGVFAFGAFLGYFIPESVRVKQLVPERRPVAPTPVVAERYAEPATPATLA